MPFCVSLASHLLVEFFILQIKADHETLIAKIETIEALRVKLGEGERVDKLCQEYIEYEAIMREHLQEEEDIALPLYRAFFTPKEGAALTMEVLKDVKKFEMGSFIYFLGPQKFRKEFMKQEGIPFFVWYLEFAGMYKVFNEGFAVPMDALRKGEEPRPPKGWFRNLFVRLSKH